MLGFIDRDSTLDPKYSIYNEILLAGDGWIHELKAGETLRILDLEGNQAVDTYFFNADNPEDNYSAVATIAAQKNIYLTTGTILRSVSGEALLEITSDKTGRHDTLGGACSSQSNTVRYAREKEYMHNCRDSFMLQLANSAMGFEKRDLAPNINFFMNVPVTEDGGLEFDDGVSAPGKYVEMKALRRVFVLISNCPQMNNPCNAYNPTPIRLIIWNDKDVQ